MFNALTSQIKKADAEYELFSARHDAKMAELGRESAKIGEIQANKRANLAEAQAAENFKAYLRQFLFGRAATDVLRAIDQAIAGKDFANALFDASDREGVSLSNKARRETYIASIRKRALELQNMNGDFITVNRKVVADIPKFAEALLKEMNLA